MNTSLKTIQSPEFINLQPLEVNPLMSSCQIKVMYVGQNRNGTIIDKKVAAEMAKTLRGAPIVGYFRKDEGDFGDHEHHMSLENGEIEWKTKTVPYGFVAPNAKVWFQFFEDVDSEGMTCLHEYLVTEGYIWNGQYPEANVIFEEGRPQSMELGEDMDVTRVDNYLFIVNDATFSKLCILGDEVEPCFEGASITASSTQNFSLGGEELVNFTKTLYSMAKELKEVLEGGEAVDKDIEKSEVEETIAEEAADGAALEEAEAEVETDDASETEEATEDYVKKKEDSETVKEDVDDDKKEVDDKDETEKEDDDKKKKKAYTLSEEQYEKILKEQEELKKDFAMLKEQNEKLSKVNEELVSYQKKVEDEKKDRMIREDFYMLSEEDLADVIAHKSEYTLDEIESKLSVICKRKKVNFSLDGNSKSNTNMTGYSLNIDNSGADVPSIVNALRETRKRNEED